MFERRNIADFTSEKSAVGEQHKEVTFYSFILEVVCRYGHDKLLPHSLETEDCGKESIDVDRPKRIADLYNTISMD